MRTTGRTNENTFLHLIFPSKQNRPHRSGMIETLNRELHFITRITDGIRVDDREKMIKRGMGPARFRRCGPELKQRVRVALQKHLGKSLVKAASPIGNSGVAA